MSKKIKQQVFGLDHSEKQRVAKNIPCITPIKQCQMDRNETSLIEVSQIDFKKREQKQDDQIQIIKQYQEELAKLNEQLEIVKEQLEVMTERCQDQKEQKETMECQIEELDQLVEGLSHQNKELNSNYKRLKQEYEHDNQQLIEELSIKYQNTLQLSQTVNIQKIQNQEKTIRELKDNLVEYITESNKHMEKCVQLTLKNDTLKKDNEKLTQDINNLQVELDYYQKTNSQLNQDKLESLSMGLNDINELKSKVSNYKKCNSQLEENLMYQMQKWSQETNQLQQKIDTLQERNDQLKQENLELQEQIYNLPKQIQEIKDYCDKVIDEQHDDKIQQSNLILEYKLNQLQIDYDKLNSQTEQEINQLKQILDQRQQRIKILEQKMEENKSLDLTKNQDQTLYYSIREDRALLVEFNQLKQFIHLLEKGQTNLNLWSQMKEQLQYIEFIISDGPIKDSLEIKPQEDQFQQFKYLSFEEEITRLKGELSKKMERINELENKSEEKKKYVIQDMSNVYHSFSKNQKTMENPASMMKQSPNKENIRVCQL